MSLAQVRSALETALATITPSIDTANENYPYTPTAGTPYQRTTLLRAQPDNIEIGPGYTERGIYQIDLLWPQTTIGAGAVEARAELIRAKFPFAASFVSGGVTVNIIATPEVAPARAEDDRFMVPVKVRFSARIGG